MAIRSFGGVKAGQLGGFVEKEENLSHEGDCFVFDDAVVCDDARVEKNSLVMDNALIFGNALLTDNAIVVDNAILKDRVVVRGDSEITDSAVISENAQVLDSALVSENAAIKDDAKSGILQLFLVTLWLKTMLKLKIMRKFKTKLLYPAMWLQRIML